MATTGDRYDRSYSGLLKVAVSIPNALFDDAEAAAARLGCSRSKLYAKALEAYLAVEAEHDPVTARLDEIAAELEGAEAGQALDQIGHRLIEDGKWEW